MQGSSTNFLNTRTVSTEQDKYLNTWAEVARLWNEREKENIKPDHAKEIGRQALLKLRTLLEDQGRTLEDMVDI